MSDHDDVLSLMAPPTTRIYSDANLVKAVPGLAVGWVDDQTLLTDVYTVTPNPHGVGVTVTFAHTNVYDAQGNLVATTPLPAIGEGFDVISPTRIFSRGDATIYDIVSGAVVKNTGLPGSPKSAVAGAYILSIQGRSLVVTPY